jgi:hypothetical protein
MRSLFGLLISFASLIWIPIATADPPGLEFDHIWIVVTRDAPERAALERAGLKISPDVNRHDGQGTASVTTEFLNAYLELMWPDPTVPVSPGAERGVEKFKNRMKWRTSGWCPIGIGLHRAGAKTTLPFPTWSIAPAWMPAGSSIEILTPRDDTRSPSFFIEPPDLMVKEEANRKRAENDPKHVAFQHPLGVERITALRLIRPKGYEPIAVFNYLEGAGIFKASEGEEWAIEVTFDGGRKAQTKDLRPDLPLILHF